MVAATVGVAVLAACSTKVSGAPITSPTSSPSKGSVLPPRPRDLRVDGIDPCALFTKAQQQRLGVDYVLRGTKPDDLGNMPCRFSHFPDDPNYTYVISAVPQRGARFFLDPDLVVVSRIASAAGFPAVIYHLPGDNAGCFVSVDVAPSQSVSIQYSYDSRPVPVGIEELCERARMGAELAVQTLETLRP